jgi:hypothetical protein
LTAFSFAAKLRRLASTLASAFLAGDVLRLSNSICTEDLQLARVSIALTDEKIKAIKIGGVTVLVLLLLFAALGPVKYRTGLG